MFNLSLLGVNKVSDNQSFEFIILTLIGIGNNTIKFLFSN